MCGRCEKLAEFDFSPRQVRDVVFYSLLVLSPLISMSPESVISGDNETFGFLVKPPRSNFLIAGDHLWPGRMT